VPVSVSVSRQFKSHVTSTLNSSREKLPIATVEPVHNFAEKVRNF
jgi:hypothetical protein